MTILKGIEVTRVPRAVSKIVRARVLRLGSDIANLGESRMRRIFWACSSIAHHCSVGTRMDIADELETRANFLKLHATDESDLHAAAELIDVAEAMRYEAQALLGRNGEVSVDITSDINLEHLLTHE